MERELTLTEKLGYSSASIADAMAYNLVGAYFMFFVTTIAGVQPRTAGILTAIGAVWNAVLNPLVGFLSDHFRSKYGQRRPVMMGFAVVLLFSLILIFTDLPLPALPKAICYGLILMCFWTGFSGYLVPYLALASCYTMDYDERTSLRFLASLFNQFGSLVIFLLPSILVAFLTGHGASPATAWMIVAVIISSGSFLSILVTFLLSKEKDPPCDDAGAEPVHIDLPAILRDYLSILKLPSARYLILASLAALICGSIMTSDLIYYLTYNRAYSASRISFLLSLRPIFGTAMLPVAAWLSARIDKRYTFMLLSGTGAVGVVLFRIAEPTSFASQILFMLLVNMCISTYWHLIPSMYLDVCDEDHLTNGQNRQATIVSFQGFVEAIGAGIGTFLLGAVLQNYGFDGSAPLQPAQAEVWIFNCCTLLPFAFMGLAMLMIWKYPITREKHHAIIQRLAEREDL